MEKMQIFVSGLLLGLSLGLLIGAVGFPIWLGI